MATSCTPDISVISVSSIEGAEALRPLEDVLVEEGATLGAEEIVMRMARRGQLNALAHMLRTPAAQTRLPPPSKRASVWQRSRAS